MGNTESGAEDVVLEGPGAPDKDTDGSVTLKSYVQRSSLTDSEPLPLNGTHGAQVRAGSGGVTQGQVVTGDDGSVFIDPSTKEGQALLHSTKDLAAQVLGDEHGGAGGESPGPAPGLADGQPAATTGKGAGTWKSPLRLFSRDAPGVAGPESPCGGVAEQAAVEGSPPLFKRLFSRDAPERSDNTFRDRPSESYDLESVDEDAATGNDSDAKQGPQAKSTEGPVVGQTAAAAHAAPGADPKPAGSPPFIKRLFSRDAPARSDNTFKGRPSESFEPGSVLEGNGQPSSARQKDSKVTGHVQPTPDGSVKPEASADKAVVDGARAAGGVGKPSLESSCLPPPPPPPARVDGEEKKQGPQLQAAARPVAQEEVAVMKQSKASLEAPAPPGKDAGKAGVSAGQGGVSAGQGGVPAGQGGVSAGQVGVPAGQGGVPAGQGGVPAGQGGVSAAKAVAPASKDAAAVSAAKSGAADTAKENEEKNDGEEDLTILEKIERFFTGKEKKSDGAEVGSEDSTSETKNPAASAGGKLAGSATTSGTTDGPVAEEKTSEKEAVSSSSSENTNPVSKFFKQLSKKEDDGSKEEAAKAEAMTEPGNKTAVGTEKGEKSETSEKVESRTSTETKENPVSKFFRELSIKDDSSTKDDKSIKEKEAKVEAAGKMSDNVENSSSADSKPNSSPADSKPNSSPADSKANPISKFFRQLSTKSDEPSKEKPSNAEPKKEEPGGEAEKTGTEVKEEAKKTEEGTNKSSESKENAFTKFFSQITKKEDDSGKDKKAQAEADKMAAHNGPNPATNGSSPSDGNSPVSWSGSSGLDENRDKSVRGMLHRVHKRKEKRQEVFGDNGEQNGNGDASSGEIISSA